MDLYRKFLYNFYVCVYKQFSIIRQAVSYCGFNTTNLALTLGFL